MEAVEADDGLADVGGAGGADQGPPGVVRRDARHVPHRAATGCMGMV